MIARRIYRLLLSLHPPLFRRRFGREMLWIFDQTAEDEGIVRLLADATLSLLKQHMAVDTAPRCTAEIFQQPPVESLGVVRFFQAGAVALLLLSGFFSLLQKFVPLPVPPKSFAIRRYSPDVCGEQEAAARTVEHQRKMRLALAETGSRP